MPWAPGAAALAVACAGCAAWLVLPDERAHSRLRRLRRLRQARQHLADDVAGWGARPGVGAAAARLARGWRRRTSSRRSTFGGAAGGLGVAVLVGGLVGAAAGVLAGLVLRWWLAGLATRLKRERAARLAADLPAAADLIAACLRAGAAIDEALTAVAEASDGPLSGVLRDTAATLRLGADPGDCWRRLEREPALRPLGATLARSAETGAPIAAAVARLADEQRHERRWAAEARARSVGVRAVLPLGLCFLPAFALLAIVPLVAGIAGAVLPTLR